MYVMSLLNKHLMVLMMVHLYLFIILNYLTFNQIMFLVIQFMFIHHQNMAIHQLILSQFIMQDYKMLLNPSTSMLLLVLLYYFTFHLKKYDFHLYFLINLLILYQYLAFIITQFKYHHIFYENNIQTIHIIHLNLMHVILQLHLM